MPMSDFVSVNGWFFVLIFAFAPSLRAESQSEFSRQAEAETKLTRAACEEFKSLFAPLEAKERTKGRLLLKQSSDIDRAITLISSFDASTPKRNKLREQFFGILKPTRGDVLSYLALDNANCAFPLYSALLRTVETAGDSNDAALKQKTAITVKHWFAANEFRQESLISTATAPLLFKSAVAGKVLKANGNDENTLKALSKEVREKSAEFADRFKAESKGMSGLTVDVEHQASRENDQLTFDPLKVQTYLADERKAARDLSGRLKSWLAER